MEALDFTDRAVVVTGASQGLGRHYALEFGRRGASVLVNARDRGEQPSAADAVVEEIRAAGGTAVAVNASVTTEEGGRAIVEGALEAFGRLDVLVNNAGYGVSHQLAEATPEAVAEQIAVHVNGAFNVTRPAYAAMREQGYGRLVFTSSPSALFGLAGYAPYAAAKTAMIGLVSAIGLEFEDEGGDVLANTLVPMASKGVDPDLPPAMQGFMEAIQPELVTPMVVYLASEACTVNRRIFWAAAGRYAEVFVGLTEGWTAGDGQPRAEDVAAQLERIADRSAYEMPSSWQQAVASLMATE